MPPKPSDKSKGAIPKCKVADHSYTKASDRGKSRSRSARGLRHQVSESDTDNDFEEQSPCHMCDKNITMNNEGIKCNFCEHWLCFPCSKLKKVVYQALRESPDNVMWFCQYCCTAFPGVKKVMVQIGSLEDRYTNLEQRVDKLEEKSQENDNNESIKDICRKEIAEQNEIEKRKLNVVVFNIPESTEHSLEAKQADDFQRLNVLMEGPMKLDQETVQIRNLVRLGAVKASKQNEVQNPRPIKFTVENFEHKNKILKANAKLREETGDLKSVFFTPDLTKTQRKEAFLLREKLRYQKNVLKKKNLKISRGRIVEVVTEATNEDRQTDEQETGLFDDAGGGATASAEHPIKAVNSPRVSTVLPQKRTRSSADLQSPRTTRQQNLVRSPIEQVDLIASSRQRVSNHHNNIDDESRRIQRMQRQEPAPSPSYRNILLAQGRDRHMVEQAERAETNKLRQLYEPTAVRRSPRLQGRGEGNDPSLWRKFVGAVFTPFKNMMGGNKRRWSDIQ